MSKVLKKIFLTLIVLIIGIIFFKGEHYALTVNKKIEKLPAFPTKIISLSLSGDEILTSLINHNRILGLTYLSANPKFSNVANQVKDIKNFVRTDPELLIKLHPDLILVSSFADLKIMNLLKRAGLSIYIYTESNNFKDIKENIKLISKPLKATELADKIVKKLNKVSKKNNFNSNIKVLYYNSTGEIAGSNTDIDDLFKLIGFKNAANSINGRRVINFEELIKLNPEVILISTLNSLNKKKNNKNLDCPEIQQLLNNPVLKTVKAIKNKQIYSIENKHFICSSPNIIKGLEDLKLIKQKIKNI